MRRVALLTLLAFGCATARPPEPFPVQLGTPRIALAEPELELWMEGTGPVDPQESSSALSRSREALAAAVAGRGLDAPEPDQLLVVRARAIARTDERKSAQVWSTVFIVVVVVAVVVTTILLSRSKSGPRAAGPAPGAHGVARPGTPVGARPPGAAFAPRRYAPPPPVGVNVGFAIWVPMEPLPPAPWLEPTQAWLASRGWWDGDATELTVELADPRTGEVSWRQTVRDSVDPRDAGAVSALLDRALAGLPFGARQVPLAELPPELPPVAPGDAGGLTPGDVPGAVAVPPSATPPVELPPPPPPAEPPPPAPAR